MNKIVLSYPTLVTLLVVPGLTLADSATWNATPVNRNWNDHNNWTPDTVPGGMDDIATFAVSATTDIQMANVSALGGIVFTADASAYTFSPADFGQVIDLFGSGITNDSAVSQHFEIGPGQALQFNGSGRAGIGVRYSLSGDVLQPAAVTFKDAASADAAVLIANAGSLTGQLGGVITFEPGTTADSSTITCNGGAILGAGGGQVVLQTLSHASNATLIANAGTNGGSGAVIVFEGSSTGDRCRLELFGNAMLDLRKHDKLGFAIGSLEGNGKINLGAANLAVGNNSGNTVFGGVIKGRRSGPSSVMKVGDGILTITGANLYTGGTIVEAGELVVNNRHGSGTGEGPVQVYGGRLSGRGIITGAVTIGTGGSGSATLSPGKGGLNPGTITIQNVLTFHADGSYNFGLNSDVAAADQVVAAGVTIDNGSIFSGGDFGTTILSSGTTFTIISNTSDQPISGTFSNLADGSTAVIGINTFQANYEGGDGNDLTLTVVP